MVIFPGAKRRRVFDIGVDEDLKKKLTEKKKKNSRLKGKETVHTVEKLWTTGAVALKTPRQLLHLVWWNDTRMFGGKLSLISSLSMFIGFLECLFLLI